AKVVGYPPLEACFADLFTHVRRRARPALRPMKICYTVYLTDSKDMKVTEIYDSEDHITALAIEDGLSVVEPNSLLFVVRSGILRRAFPVAITKIQLTVNQDLKILNLFDKTIVDYLLLMMQGFEQYILQNLSKTGTTVESIKFDEFSTHYFIFPPLAEQHRIVAKVNELMSLCDALEQEQVANIAAHQTLVEELLTALTQKTPSPQPLSREAGEGLREDHDTSCSPSTASRERGLGGEGLSWQCIAAHFDTLFTTEHSIDQLKQTILQLAVMGKLVPQEPQNEPASVLLKKIAAEKARLIKEDKIKKEKPLPAITDNEKPFELPNEWEWCRLNDLALESEAGWSPLCKPNAREGDTWGVLKVSAVTWGVFKPNENKELPNELEPKNQYEVHPGDFLISRANTAELVARAVVVPENAPKKLMMSDKIIRFVFSKNVSNQFVNLVNNSLFSRAYYMIVAGGTSSSMKNVSREQVRNLIIALPPLAEQHRIVAKVDELMALCDAMKAQLKTAQTTQLQLADVLAGGVFKHTAYSTAHQN
ncbi:MAG: restriction endonuclease subunit S, partial [Thiothrix sp.]|uniref:restriction endonuclease subunit S n=1 Tax=Thiothrix sp. TaxID=1032 RepID=UPI002616C6D8